ncbi:hypothetical protein [Maribacter litoralis]|uniref:hypothetical protein n=1 Tax=Maribacter litoralis TaxID=2059726 RepID=UPI003F5CCE46
MNIVTERILENYKYDAEISFGIYLALDKDKIELNQKEFNQYPYEISKYFYTDYLIKHCSFDEYTILSILDNQKSIHCQLLITSKEAFEYLDIKTLNYNLDYVIAELVFNFFN